MKLQNPSLHNAVINNDSIINFVFMAYASFHYLKPTVRYRFQTGSRIVHGFTRTKFTSDFTTTTKKTNFRDVIFQPAEHYSLTCLRNVDFSIFCTGHQSAKNRFLLTRTDNSNCHKSYKALYIGISKKKSKWVFTSLKCDLLSSRSLYYRNQLWSKLIDIEHGGYMAIGHPVQV